MVETDNKKNHPSGYGGMVEMAKLIKFSQPNCRGCTVMDNVINEVEPNIEIRKVDISVDKHLVDEYDLTGVPTMIVVNKYGMELARVVGTMTEDGFSEWIKLFEDNVSEETLWGEVRDNG